MANRPAKRKILFVCHTPNTYGDPSNVYEILQSLDRSRYDAVVTVHQEGAFQHAVEALEYPVITLQQIQLSKGEYPPLQELGERLSWWLWKQTRGEKVVKLVKEQKIDLIHTSSIVCFEGAYAAYQTGCPHLWQIQDILPGNRRVFGVLSTLKTLKMISQYSDKVLCASDVVKRQFPGWQRQPEKYLTLYPGVHTNLFNPEKFSDPAPALRELFKIPSTHCIIGCAWKRKRSKGFRELLDACSILKQQFIPFTLIVLGPQKALQHQIMASGLTENTCVIETPPQQALPNLLQQIDIWVSPNPKDPFPQHVLEAMAMKIPVVANNSGGATEIIIPNKTGILVKGDSPDNLAQGIQRLIEDARLRESLGTAGRERVLNEFTIQHTLTKIYSLYEHILG